MSPNANLSPLLGVPVIESKVLRPGDFYVADRKIFVRAYEYALIKLWVADMARDLRANLASLVADAEARWFGAS